MIDLEIINYTFLAVAFIYAGSVFVDIATLSILLFIETRKWNSFILKVEKDDFIDDILMDEVILLMNKRRRIASKYN